MPKIETGAGSSQSVDTVELDLLLPSTYAQGTHQGLTFTLVKVEDIKKFEEKLHLARTNASKNECIGRIVRIVAGIFALIGIAFALWLGKVASLSNITRILVCTGIVVGVMAISVGIGVMGGRLIDRLDNLASDKALLAKALQDPRFQEKITFECPASVNKVLNAYRQYKHELRASYEQKKREKIMDRAALV